MCICCHCIALQCNAVTGNRHCRIIMDAGSVAPSLSFEKAFIGTIKDPKHDVNIHKKRDFVHAVIYEDPTESIDYMDLKKLVDEDNGLILYTIGLNKYIGKDKGPITWKKCVDLLQRKPPNGSVCVTLHDKPLTFGKFAEFAYSKAILTNSEAFDDLKARLTPDEEPNPTFPDPTASSCVRSTKDKSSIEAVKSGIQAALVLGEKADISNLPPMSAGVRQLTYSSINSTSVGSNLVIGDSAVEHGELSREYWQQRALTAESKVQELEEKLAVQNDELTEMRASLRDSNNLKEGFAANADLAQAAVRETQVLAAQSIIDGLKPQFTTLPMISRNIESLNAKLAAMGDLPNMVKALENLPAMVKDLAGLPNLVAGLQASMDKAVENSVDTDNARASESESLQCLITRVLKVLDQYGLSKETKGYNLPAAVDFIRVQLGNSCPPPSSSANASCAQGLGWTSVDVSRPPPTVRAPGTSFLLDPRNNNTAPAGLMTNQGGYGYVPSNCGQCPGHAHAHGFGHGMGPPPQQGQSHQNKRSYPFGEPQWNLKK